MKKALAAIGLLLLCAGGLAVAQQIGPVPVPAALPPSGAAGGVLGGTYPNPSFADSAPVSNQFVTGTSAGALARGQPAFPGISGALDLTSQVTGVLPTANGGVPQTAWSAYTPTATPGSGAITSYTAIGHYIQIQKTICFAARVTITSAGSGAGTLNITLPVTSSSTIDYAVYGREDAVTGIALSSFIHSAAPTLAGTTKYDGTTVIATNNAPLITGCYGID